jgi:hypothetical protein
MQDESKTQTINTLWYIDDKILERIGNFWSNWYFWPATRWYGEKYGYRSAWDEPIIIKEAAKEEARKRRRGHR